MIDGLKEVLDKYKDRVECKVLLFVMDEEMDKMIQFTNDADIDINKIINDTMHRECLYYKDKIQEDTGHQNQFQQVGFFQIFNHLIMLKFHTFQISYLLHTILVTI